MLEKHFLHESYSYKVYQDIYFHDKSQKTLRLDAHLTNPRQNPHQHPPKRRPPNPIPTNQPHQHLITHHSKPPPSPQPPLPPTPHITLQQTSHPTHGC